MPLKPTQAAALARLLAIPAEQRSAEQKSQLANLERKKLSKGQANPTKTKGPRGGGRSYVQRPLRDANQSMMSPLKYLDQDIPWTTLGETDAGRAFVKQVMHPPSAAVNSFYGVPDATTGTKLSFRLATEQPIAWDASMFGTAPSAPTTYSLSILFPDIPEIAAIYRLKDDKNNVWSKVRVIRNVQFDGAPLSEDYNICTALDDQGICDFRVTASSATMTFTGPDLANQGQLYAGQYRPSIIKKDMANIPEQTAGTPLKLEVDSATTRFSVIALESPKQLIARDPAAITGAAKDGAFLPLKYAEPLTGYQYAEGFSGAIVEGAQGDGSVVNADSFLQVGFSDFAYSDHNQSSDDMAFWQEFVAESAMKLPAGKTFNFLTKNANISHYHGGISPADNMLWGHVMVTGLTIGEGGVGGASFQMSRYTYLDARASGRSLVNVFARQVPIYDPKALEMVVRMQQRYPSAFPAACNGFFDWIKGAFKWLTNNRETVASAVKLIPIPGVSVAADLAKEALPAINEAINGSP